ncbi:uncharacterized protein LOC100369071 isoform X2 [Saccoglossus kowalevskii]
MDIQSHVHVQAGEKKNSETGIRSNPQTAMSGENDDPDKSVLKSYERRKKEEKDGIPVL